MQRSTLIVGAKPYCVWGIDLRERNLAFLRSVDHEYFRYVAEAHLNHLDGQNRQRAAVAIRTGYHQGLETLFSLLCASYQAPDCVYGWLMRCRTHQLRELVARGRAGKAGEFNKLGLPKVTWQALSQKIHSCSKFRSKSASQASLLFAGLWSRLARDFLDDKSNAEYNSIKHGFRARLGGFTLRAGIEDTPGVPAPKNKMMAFAGSAFGTEFHVCERIAGVPRENFTTRMVSLNWLPESAAHALVLISLSIRNVLSFLRILNGDDPSSVEFCCPEDDEYFEEPWKKHIGVSSATFGPIISAGDISPLTASEIRDKVGLTEA